MINIIGRVTKDLEPQISPSGIQYVSFDVAENKGFGDKAKTQFHRCTIWGEEEVSRIVKAKVQKGSLLNVVGDQELSAYASKSSGELMAQSNISMWHWNYVQTGGKKPDDAGNAAGNSANTYNGLPEFDDSEMYNDVPNTDCDDGLPV